MRIPLLTALAAFASATTARDLQVLKSTTYIEPAKSFLLGGGQPGRFTVAGKSVGRTDVTVFVERAGRRDSIATLTPGKKVDAEFPAGSMAVFRNESNGVSAELALEVRGKIDGLGMRYEPARR